MQKFSGGQVHQFSWRVLPRSFGGCIVQVRTSFVHVAYAKKKSSSAGARAFWVSKRGYEKNDGGMNTELCELCSQSKLTAVALWTLFSTMRNIVKRKMQ